MTTLHHRFVILSLFLLLALWLAPVALASPPTPTGGSFIVTSATMSDVRAAGPNTIFSWRVTFENTGALDGPSVATLRCVVRPTGQGRCHGPETFTGSVAGRSGTAVFQDTIAVDTVQGTVSGRFVIVSGTGDLATLRGQGTFQARGSTGSYTLNMHFDG